MRFYDRRIIEQEKQRISAETDVSEPEWIFFAGAVMFAVLMCITLIF